MDSGWDFTALISIHAPPRGATGTGTHRKDCEQISIHAPPRGATGTSGLALHQGSLFQFTPLREGRLQKSFFRIHSFAISIHAPPRGATLPAHQVRKYQSHFNSRPSARGDGIACCCAIHSRISIHAPPRGATVNDSAALNIVADFNSRPSARGDLTFAVGEKYLRKISIHAPPRGATAPTLSEDAKADIISIHAPPRGATLHTLCIGFRGYFNSRPSARGDGDDRQQVAVVDISIHAPPRGATRRPR